MSTIYESECGKYDLSGYVKDGKPSIKEFDGKTYSIQQYQMEHKDEYTVMEMKDGKPNGLAQLYKDGVIQLSWKMKEGNPEGSLTIYEDGVVSRMTTWSTLNDTSSKRRSREVMNDESGKRLLIEKLDESGMIVYKGGYNALDLSREGYGVEFDEKSGVEKSAGYYRNDKLFHIHQRFVHEDGKEGKMIEFDGDEKVENVDDLLNRRSVYIGGYAFDKERNEFVRQGRGCEIDKYQGVCKRIVDADGCEKVLYGGWYGEGECDRSISVNMIDGEMLKKKEEEDEVERKRKEERKREEEEEIERKRKEEEEARKEYWEEQLSICPGLDYAQARGVEDLRIGVSVMNTNNSDVSKMKFVLKNFPKLKTIWIGSKSLQYVREFVIDGLASLEIVEIGGECLKIQNSERNDGVCRITNCDKLRKLEIGDQSFRDFKQFELSNVNSLQSINFGDHCFYYYADCILKDIPSLQQVSFGGHSFDCCHFAQFENLPKLTTISFNGDYALIGDYRDNMKTTINGHTSYHNTLIMRDLPSLTSIQGNVQSIHYYMGHVILKNIPKLAENNIHFGQYSFNYTQDLKVENADALANVIRRMPKA